MRRTALKPLFLLLLLAPLPASGETEPWGGSLRGPSVGADAQVLQAPLAAGKVIIGGNAPDPLPWTLEGASVEVYTEIKVWNDPDDMPEPDPRNPMNVTGPSRHATVDSHADFSARMNRSAPGAIFVFPHTLRAQREPPVLERTIGTVELIASDQDVFWSHDDDEPDNPRDRAYDVANTTFVRDTDSALRYVVRGDFLVDTRNSDWLVRDAHGETLYTSGEHFEVVDPNDPTGYDPDPENDQPGRRENRMLHLFVRDGTLTVPGNSHLQFRWYLGDGAHVRSEDAVLRSATGTVRAGAQGVVLAGDDLEFRGRVDLSRLRARDGLLHYDVASGAPSVFVEGDRVDAPARVEPVAPDADPSPPAPDDASPVTVATTAPDGGAGGWWSLLLLPLVVAALVVARPPFWLVAASVRAGLHGYAARHAPRFLPGPHGPSAAVLGAVSLLGRARYEDAVRFLGGLGADVRPAPATWHYLQAHARAGLGDEEGALQHLDACLALAPEYGHEVLGNPVLRRLVDADPARFRAPLGAVGASH